METKNRLKKADWEACLQHIASKRDRCSRRIRKRTFPKLEDNATSRWIQKFLRGHYCPSRGLSTWDGWTPQDLAQYLGDNFKLFQMFRAQLIRAGSSRWGRICNITLGSWIIFQHFEFVGIGTSTKINLSGLPRKLVRNRLTSLNLELSSCIKKKEIASIQNDIKLMLMGSLHFSALSRIWNIYSNN